MPAETIDLNARGLHVLAPAHVTKSVTLFGSKIKTLFILARLMQAIAAGRALRLERRRSCTEECLKGWNIIADPNWFQHGG